MINDIKSFEERVPELKIILSRRRSSWTLTTMDWEDVEMILLERLWKKWHLYNQTKGPLENWANTVISRGMSNLLRKELHKFSKPCISATEYGGMCAFNKPGDGCGYTPSGIKCGECPKYREWQRKKESLYNIKSSLPLDSHIQEVQNKTDDFIDIEGIKLILDKKIIDYLSPLEIKIYNMLYIENLSMEDVSKKMKYKTQKNSAVSQVLRKMIIKFKKITKEIIEKEGLV